jgi:hypothetical protein
MRQKRILGIQRWYWKYFKIFRIDFAWRANYLNVPETNRFYYKRIVRFNLGAIPMRFNLSF